MIHPDAMLSMFSFEDQAARGNATPRRYASNAFLCLISGRRGQCYTQTQCVKHSYSLNFGPPEAMLHPDAMLYTSCFVFVFCNIGPPDAMPHPDAML